jgi:haloacetate dehalogenase
MHTLFDVLATWRDKAGDVRGKPLPCGHFIPEEAPGPLLAELMPFLAEVR